MNTGTSTAPNLLVVGSGSVGKRHARNLHDLGAAISVVDPREDRRNEIAAELALEADYDSMHTAFEAGSFDGVVVASPTTFHVNQAVSALQAGLPVLLEKPVATGLQDAISLQRAVAESGSPLLLGYTWRWWPALKRVRELVKGGEIGVVRHVRCTLSAHLADWHPWEPYQEFFMSSMALGGGALLDESHWIDLACWLFGAPAEVFARIERLSELEIDTDDNVDLWLSYDAGPRIWLHLDVHGRPHERSLTISGEHGTITWSDNPDVVRVGTGVDEWREEPFSGERNDMFVGVAQDFLRLVAGEGTVSCGVDDGIEVMRVIEAARRSHDLGRVVPLAEL